MRLYIVRHGESTANRDKITQGQSDTDLTELGYIQAKAIAKRLKDYSFDKIYASDLKRATETAKEINKYHKKQIILDRDLREINRGDFTGISHEIISPLFDKLKGKFYEKKAPNGENFLEHIKRVSIFLENLDLNSKENILIVVHGGTIRSILTNLHKYKIPPKNINELFPIPNTCFYEIEINENQIKYIHKGCNKHIIDLKDE